MWNELIKPELLVLMPFLYGVGILIKNTPNIKDWLIPYILLGVSIAITVVYMAFVIGEGFNGRTMVMAVIQGTFIALTTVGGNELYKQATCGRKEDNVELPEADEPPEQPYIDNAEGYDYQEGDHNGDYPNDNNNNLGQ